MPNTLPIIFLLALQPKPDGTPPLPLSSPFYEMQKLKSQLENTIYKTMATPGSSLRESPNLSINFGRRSGN